MSAPPIWEGKGQLKGWTVAKMGDRVVARLNGRLVGAADHPPAVKRAIRDAGPRPPRQQQLPLDTPARAPRPKKEPCRCPEQPARPRRQKAAPCEGPAPTLLPRKSTKAILFVWFAPARPARKGGGLRLIGGWPNTDAGAAMAAAKVKPLPSGVLYVNDKNNHVLKTAVKAGE